jgi:hypothetical protein
MKIKVKKSMDDGIPKLKIRVILWCIFGLIWLFAIWYSLNN